MGHPVFNLGHNASYFDYCGYTSAIGLLNASRDVNITLVFSLYCVK